MNDLVRAARAKIPKSCQSKKCSREGCSVLLTGIGNERVIVDMDCKELDIPEDRIRCDYLFVGAENRIAPIELKRGSVEASEVAEQLRTGTAFAERELVPGNAEAHFRPIVAYGGKLHRSQSEALKKRQYQIEFRGAHYEVKLIRCGSPLALALK